MTIGPAPMIRIDLMSVRFGIALRNPASSFRGAALSFFLDSGSGLWPSRNDETCRRTKKGRANARPSVRADRGEPRARALFRPESPGREGAVAPREEATSQA